MNILLSHKSNKPIYEQIKSQIKNSILSGQLIEGEPLPSIRKLAKDLEVSVITTKRAYEDLEAEGYVTSLVGKGTFVAKQEVGKLKESKIRQIEHHLEIVIEDAQVVGLSLENLQQLLKSKFKEE
ncbi:Transcriptional regulator, GntR family [Alkalibacterium sp. AK22]|uniref:GntR family transcriptional regulator n=1 Tax=Alkalibacterium sp. AK22 TaxID=1229520 RepID=UPI00044A50AB|nr:GntR family transcriptional regulator [Alkalibacterium sp. AK22]EXJ23859.1 Transcriptional regulator, GntR family [Alkalibacterium sp. AK22]